MRSTETLYYEGIFYTWHLEPKNEHSDRHISLLDCAKVISACQETTIRFNYDTPRWKFIGIGSHTVITVITEDDLSTIVTSWKSSKEEQHRRIVEC